MTTMPGVRAGTCLEEDARRLASVGGELEDSASEVPMEVLLEVAALSLRLASAWVAGKNWHACVARAFWASRSGSALAVGNAAQNLLCGGTRFSVDDRAEFLRAAEEAAYFLLFRIEELLVDVARVESEELLRRERTSSTLARLRRIESAQSASVVRRKNWLHIVFEARDLVAVCLQLPSADHHDRALRARQTQQVFTRRFIAAVIHSVRTRELMPNPITDVFLAQNRVWQFLKRLVHGISTRVRGAASSTLRYLAPSIDPTATTIPTAGAGPPPPPQVEAQDPLRFHYPFWFSRAAQRGMLGIGMVCLTTLAVRTMAPSAAIRGAAESARFWYVQHLTDPAREMVQELFFQKTRSVSDRDAARDAKESLNRMIESWRRDHGELASEFPPPTEAVGGVANRFHVSQISRAYEKAILHPIREFLAGDLLRLALIQVQLLKSETLALATELDQVVAENRFNTQLLAALPAVAILYQVARAGRTFVLWARDESSSLEAVRRELNLVFWEVTTLLIREDDGPRLFSFVSVDDRRGSELGGSEEDTEEEFESNSMSPRPLANRHLLPPTAVTSSSSEEYRANPVTGDGNGEGDDVDDIRGYTLTPLQLQLDESAQREDEYLTSFLAHLKAQDDSFANTRKAQAGRLVHVLHHMVRLLRRSRSILFREAAPHEFLYAMRDIQMMFPREGMSTQARLRLVRNLQRQVLRGR